MTLYEIAGYLEEIRTLYMMDEKEIDEEVLKRAEEECFKDFTKKADGYGQLIKEFLSEAEEIKKEEDRLKKRREARIHCAERLKNRLRDMMEYTGTKKIEGTLFSFTVSEGKEKIPDDLPLTMVPEEYIRHGKDTIKKDELMKAIKEGKITNIPVIRGKSSITMR